MAGCYINANSHLSWDALTPYILPWVLGAPEELLMAQARLACIELCRRSGILHDENHIDLQKGVTEYFLTTLCDYQIVRTYEVTMLNQWTFRPTIDKPLRRNGGPFNSVGYYGTSWWCGPYGFYMPNVDVVQITPATQQDFPLGLRVEFIVMPKQDGCTLDNYLYENFAEGIAAGAISRLKKIKGTNWYDPPGALDYERAFQKEITRARGIVDMNFTSGSVMMQAERWV
jgi:hypothetical protein